MPAPITLLIARPKELLRAGCIAMLAKSGVPVIESLLAQKAVDLHIEWIRISKEGHVDRDHSRYYVGANAERTADVCWEAYERHVATRAFRPGPVLNACPDAPR